MRTTTLALASALTAFASSSAIAQTLPIPSRIVYKCEQGGKGVYSDAPCLGAQRVDVEPTRGLNKLSGTQHTGADVRQERHNERMAEALRPILNESPEQRTQRHRRAKLSPDAKAQCDQLDNLLVGAELEEKQATGADRQLAQSRLFGVRSQYRELKC